jgi:N-acetyl-anhydromuramyl-L-alanine amidase AmpD
MVFREGESAHGNTTQGHLQGWALMDASSDYASANFYPAAFANYTAANRPYSNLINKIVIHVAQGSWSSAINWFQRPQAQASAHYTVRSSDGFVGQSVLEKDIAWHSGNWSYNQASIGIEHEGYFDDPAWFTDTMFRSSAQLTAYLVNRYQIPIDRAHIIGHYEVPDPYNPGSYGGASHHIHCPGDYWWWDLYMGYVNQYALG